jgi:hypothetical protein
MRWRSNSPNSSFAPNTGRWIVSGSKNFQAGKVKKEETNHLSKGADQKKRTIPDIDDDSEPLNKKTKQPWKDSKTENVDISAGIQVVDGAMPIQAPAQPQHPVIPQTIDTEIVPLPSTRPATVIVSIFESVC